MAPTSGRVEGWESRMGNDSTNPNPNPRGGLHGGTHTYLPALVEWAHVRKPRSGAEPGGHDHSWAIGGEDLEQLTRAVSQCLHLSPYWLQGGQTALHVPPLQGQARGILPRDRMSSPRRRAWIRGPAQPRFCSRRCSVCKEPPLRLTNGIACLSITGNR